MPIAKGKEFGLDMVIMRGPPGCGKSAIAQKHLVSAGYVWINRDTLKTKAKCLKAARSALESGSNVVVDNTNPDRKSRAPFIEIAKKHKANVRVFNMTTERAVAEHCNLIRERLTDGKRKRVSSVVYNVFFKKVREEEPPSVDDDEGLNEVIDVDFVPDFVDEKHRKLWLQFT